MLTEHVLYTGRAIQVSDQLTMVRIWSMDGKKSISLSRIDINAIRKAAMIIVATRTVIDISSSIQLHIFPNRMNIGLFSESARNGVLLTAGEFIDIYSHLNPLFAEKKADRSIFAGFFGALFVR